MVVYDEEINLPKLADQMKVMTNFTSSIEYVKDFLKVYGKFLEREDRVEITKISTQLDAFHWKYFKKFVYKIKHNEV
jgi:cytochrome c peroxidase